MYPLRVGCLSANNKLVQLHQGINSSPPMNDAASRTSAITWDTISAPSSGHTIIITFLHCVFVNLYHCGSYWISTLSDLFTLLIQHARRISLDHPAQGQLFLSSSPDPHIHNHTPSLPRYKDSRFHSSCYHNLKHPSVPLSL